MITSLRIIHRAITQFGNHNAAQMGAALSYYTLFSLAPLLLVAISIAGLVFGEDAAQGKVYTHLVDTLGQDSARMVQGLVRSADEIQAKNWAPYLGVALSLFAALQAFLHLRQSFRIIWELGLPSKNTLLGVLIDYGFSVLMVFTIGLLLLASLGGSTVLALVENKWPLPIPGGWQTVEIVVSFLILTLLFATLFWVLSGHALHLGYVLYGSLICSLLFTIGKTLLAWYLAFTSTTSIYGAAGTLVGFLVWVYYSSQIVFLGAELIQARRTRSEWLK